MSEFIFKRNSSVNEYLIRGDKMVIFFWIVDLIIPITMIITGLVFRSNPPKKINTLVGYRTKRSMESQEAWDFAQKRLGESCLKMGAFLLIIIFLSKLFSPINEETLSLIHAGIGVLALVITLPFIERKLKGV